MPTGLNLVCLNCGSSTLDHFYRVDNVPVHSVLLMRSRSEAMVYPKKDISLALCSSCGFIQNTSFDPHCHEYSERYEETQGYSPHFQKFSQQLASDLIERHQLYNKTIVEIGCGKGEFLTLLCRLGGNRGIGIDASYVSGRHKDHSDINVSFIQGFFEDNTGPIEEADVIVCRHTLEHIPDTALFLRRLRQAIPESRNPVIYFDLPDTTRVLSEAAFWDVYYEHCSYFTASSLAAVFRAEGFNTSKMYRLYDDQMLAIEARPSTHLSENSFELEMSIDELTLLTGSFSQAVKQAIYGWEQCIKEEIINGRAVAIWGSGSKAVAFISALDVDCSIDAVVDINPHRQGSYLPGSGYRIEPPEYLSSLKPGLVIIMNPVYRFEIISDLEKLGVEAKVLWL